MDPKNKKTLLLSILVVSVFFVSITFGASKASAADGLISSIFSAVLSTPKSTCQPGTVKTGTREAWGWVDWGGNPVSDSCSPVNKVPTSKQVPVPKNDKDRLKPVVSWGLTTDKSKFIKQDPNQPTRIQDVYGSFKEWFIGFGIHVQF